MLGRGHPGRSTHDMVADAVDARTIPLQQLEPAPLEASDGCISRCHAIVRLYQKGGSYVADLLDVRNPERTDSNRATVRPLGNAGRGPPLATGTWMRLLRHKNPAQTGTGWRSSPARSRMPW